MSDETTDRTPAAGQDPQDGWARLIDAAMAGNVDLLAQLCARYGREISGRAGELARVPESVRADQASAGRWMNAVMMIAEQLNAIGHPQLLDVIAGSGRDNPAVRLRDTIGYAQQLAADGQRDASSSLLRDLIHEMEGATGPLVDHLRSRALGTLAENALAARDYASLRTYTAQALAAAHDARDGDGVREFTENFDMIDAIDAYVRHSGLTGDLLQCRERIARAQRLSDDASYAASTLVLRDVEAGLERDQDGVCRRYRAKVWGLLGLNCYRLGDVIGARTYTERALEECTAKRDREGIRIYKANLDVIDRASDSGRAG
jgi:hypothetical protein